MEQLRSSHLPLTHYYVWGTPQRVKDAGYQWILDIWDAIRGYTPPAQASPEEMVI